MAKLKEEYNKLFQNKRYRNSFAAGIFLLILAGIVTSLAISYADSAQGSAVGDLVLDNIPTLELVWARFLITAIVTFSIIGVVISKPKYLPAWSKTVGIMYIIRAFFISLTHLKAYPGKVNLHESIDFINFITFQGNDLFFSGHVSLPFISALVFWKHKRVRNYLLIASIVMGTIMIFSKAHYSIDVFAAPFMSYAIFKLSEKFFEQDFRFVRGR